MYHTINHTPNAHSEGRNEGCGGGPERLQSAVRYCLRLPRVTFGFPQTNPPPLRSAFAFSYIKRERIEKVTSDLPATASREHPKYALERPCRLVRPSAPRCAAWTTSIQTDAQPCAVVGRFALVALPFALAAIGQRRGVLPVAT